MSWLALYLALLKGTVTTFAGFTSLPVMREKLVSRRHVLTDDQLNRVVAVARSTPGPMGLHVVSIGYQTAGRSGAFAGWLAMVTPAFLVLPLLHFAGRNSANRRVRSALNAIVVSSAALLAGTAVFLARSAIGTWSLAFLTGSSLLIFATTRQPSLRVMLVAGGLGMIASALRMWALSDSHSASRNPRALERPSPQRCDVVSGG